MSESKPRVLVTGGAGYVGGVLVPRMLAAGYRVRVLDLFMFEPELFADVQDPRLECVRGDLRDQDLLRRALDGCDIVLHLACVSNDPSFELDPALSRSINFDAFEPLVKLSKAAGVRRFVYASTSSVYGISEQPEVDEDHPLLPITDYNKYKGLCEPVLLGQQAPGFTTVVIRPATVCGYSPRQRLDLTVNILTAHAVEKGKITIFGGEQQRPNIHIDDVVDLYLQLFELPDERIAGRTYNAGWENHTVAAIAERVKAVVEQELPDRAPIVLERVPSDDKRSYHISSARIRRELGFAPRRTIEDAVRDLVRAFRAGKLPDALASDRYYNVRAMQRLKLV